jgi:hypothetical protein
VQGANETVSFAGRGGTEGGSEIKGPSDPHSPRGPQALEPNATNVVAGEPSTPAIKFSLPTLKYGVACKSTLRVAESITLPAGNPGKYKAGVHCENCWLSVHGRVLLLNSICHPPKGWEVEPVIDPSWFTVNET